MAVAVGTDRRPKPLKLSVRPTRKLSTTHAYGKLYWEKLKPILDERWDQYIAENPGAGGTHLRSNRLNYQNKLLRELLDAEPEDIKKEVERRREEGIAFDDDGPEPELEGAGESTSATEKQRRAKAYALQK